MLRHWQHNACREHVEGGISRVLVDHSTWNGSLLSSRQPGRSGAGGSGDPANTVGCEVSRGTNRTIASCRATMCNVR